MTPEQAQQLIESVALIGAGMKALVFSYVVLAFLGLFRR